MADMATAARDGKANEIVAISNRENLPRFSDNPQLEGGSARMDKKED